MSRWYIARATNMSFVKVVLNLLDHNHWADQQNPSAIPSGLADWGFLSPANAGKYDDTDLGRVAMSARWSWQEIVLHALAKRGACDPAVTVRPLVVMAKALLGMKNILGLQHAYLTDRSFTRLSEISSYAQLTDQYCQRLNEPDRPGESGVLTYYDIWLNALEAAGILEKVNNKFILRNECGVFEFLQLLDDHGDEMSQCPDKSASPSDFYAYMGDVTKGLPEILSKASEDLLQVMFPHYHRGGLGWRMLVPQVQTSLNGILCDLGPGLVSLGSGLSYDDAILRRFISALSAKPFVVLTGLSGSGKTKLAQAVVNWLSVNHLGLKSCFYPGLIIERRNTDLTIVSADDVGLVVSQGNGVRTSLSSELVDQYVESMIIHGPGVTRQQVMSDHQNSISYSPTMHMFDAVLIPLAAYKLEHSTASEFITRLLVPVGADWTNSEKLLGYPNALDKESYVMPDSGVLKLMMDAEKNPTLPFFLILDEMNLSHLERYFADFLSAMESGDEIKLYDGDLRYGDKEKTTAIPRRIRVPKNLFVIGTMNVDETTYMFSPKVLDRAQVIEFRVKDNEMADFVGHFDNQNPPQWVPGKATKVDLSKLADANGVGKGAKYAESFLSLALGRGEKKPSAQPFNDPNDQNNPDNGKVPLQEIAKALNAFFKPLSELGAEFGYRSASEILSFCGYYLDTGVTIDAAIDAAVMQKLLPKLHGSRRKLLEPLKVLWSCCLKDPKANNAPKIEDAKGNAAFDYEGKCLYPMAAEKIVRMYRSAIDNGFASFAEA